MEFCFLLQMKAFSVCVSIIELQVSTNGSGGQRGEGACPGNTGPWKCMAAGMKETLLPTQLSYMLALRQCKLPSLSLHILI